MLSRAPHAHTLSLSHTHTRTNTHSYTPVPSARWLDLPRRRNAAELGEQHVSSCLNVPHSQEPEPEGPAWSRLCYWPKTLLFSAIAITGRFVQGWAVVWAAEGMHLGEGHRAGDLYMCEGLKAVLFQHGGGWLGGAPVSRRRYVQI